MLVTAAEPLGPHLLPMQEREFHMELEVYIISDVCFSSEVKRLISLHSHFRGSYCLFLFHSGKGEQRN